ncbi:type II secretion system secretin GspD [Cloacibacillus evryensis]|uniref:Type II secretion system secretin GspD n=1 Tax=Cloacibacillus evryensis TaxID=508460 RepID=A0AAW5K4H4_9BACT|nr:type II secretion system secretin GspD [Cloacibacillus evryensis]MCQ4764073.1 type II secretion system secretin GspD [Cloacibacillus evryensis]MCQ4814060.1 type II secretion system secretin GspD [Cloacibacillus evryensis]
MHSKKRFFYTLFIAAAISVSACTMSTAAEPDQEELNLIKAAQEMRAAGRVQLNFKDLDMAKFIRFMSELLGENILVNPGVSGKVSVVSPKAVTLKEARQVMLSVLEMNNLSIQDMEGYSKVVPLSTGGTASNMIVKGDQSVDPSDTIMVQLVPLSYVKAGYVVSPLKTAIPQIQISPIGNGSSVLLVGKAALLSRAVGVIRAIDAPDSIRTIKVCTLQYANAKLLEAQLNAVAKDASSKLAGMVAVSDERTKRVILVGSSQNIREADRIIKSLDVPSRTENFHVYRLKNADAKTVAEQLSQILSVAAKLSPDPKGAMPSTVVPDLPTNSLVFTATQEQFNSLKTILEQLDTQPKQVLLRGMIAEVSLNKLNSAGIDWAAWGGDIFGSIVGAGNIQLGNTAVPSDIQTLYQSLITKEELVERNGSTYSVTNTQGAGLVYAYIKLLNKFDAVNVLSMPRLMCTDNLQSSLQVGQVIPQLKGSLTNQTNTNSVTNSYEYKDVGLILTVTPHIRSGNLVALDIEQRIEDLLTTTNSTTPITSKREVKTSVLVANGETVVIGGLIKEAEKELKNRVPLFSYIPLIGNLFKSQEKQREKVDLMIFLTPYILETPQHASKITNEIITDGQKLSEAERILMQRNNEDYLKSTKQQGITREMLDPHGQLSGMGTSDDVKPREKAPANNTDKQ